MKEVIEKAIERGFELSQFFGKHYVENKLIQINHWQTGYQLTLLCTLSGKPHAKGISYYQIKVYLRGLI